METPTENVITSTENIKPTTNDGKKVSLFKRVVSIILNVLFFLFFIVCVFSLYMSITSKQSTSDATDIFGYQARIVLTSSMEKCDLTDVSNYEIKDIPVKSMVFIKTVPDDEKEADEWYSQLKVGDVLTFRYTYSTQVTITHRIVDISAKETGGYIIVLEGDNKVSEDNVGQQTIDTSIENSTNYVIGKVTGTSVAIGYLITAVKSTWGTVFIVIVPCSIIIIFEIFRIADIIMQKRKETLKAEQQKKDDEIEQLKKLLAQANLTNLAEQSATSALPVEKLVTESAPSSEESTTATTTPVEQIVTNVEQIVTNNTPVEQIGDTPSAEQITE